MSEELSSWEEFLATADEFDDEEFELPVESPHWFEMLQIYEQNIRLRLDAISNNLIVCCQHCGNLMRYCELSYHVEQNHTRKVLRTRNEIEPPETVNTVVASPPTSDETGPSRRRHHRRRRQSSSLRNSSAAAFNPKIVSVRGAIDKEKSKSVWEKSELMLKML